MPERSRNRRAVVVGAGSFGTAVAVLLARGGMRTTLQARTAEQAERMAEDASNVQYLPEVELPRELRIEAVSAGLARADYVFLGVPSRGLDEVIAGLAAAGLRPARGGRLAGQGARAARRHRADDPACASSWAPSASPASAGPPTRARW